MSDNTIKKIDQSLANFLERADKEHQLKQVGPFLFNSIKEFVLRKGKRIRPSLLIYSYQGYKKNNKRLSPSIYYLSTCIELLHNFMLIHDDIIDRSDLRRGKPTMHRILSKAVKADDPLRLGHDLSIIAGDIVYALAFDAFFALDEDLKRKERALKYFNQTTIHTAMGEYIDTLFGVLPVKRVKEKDVFLNYNLKTARYTFQAPLVVGALLAGAPQSEIKRLSQIGLLIGQAFQIQDDIIGIFDTQKNIGKSILSDLAESKKTILVCHAYKKLALKDRKRFLHYFSKNKPTYNDLITIRKIFNMAGSLNYSINLIAIRLKKAAGLLNKLSIKPQNKKLIEQSLFQLFNQTRAIARAYNVTFE